MKNTCKRTLSLLLALLLAVSLWVPAYAAAEEGEITITYKAPGGTACTYMLSFPGAEDLKTGFTILPGTKIPYSKLLPMEGKETANSITTDVVWMNWKTAAGDLIYPNTTIQNAIELRGAAKISKESALKVTFTPDVADGGTENANPWYFYLHKEDSSNENTEAWSKKFPSQANGFPAGFQIDTANGEVWYDAGNKVEATTEETLPSMQVTGEVTFKREFKVTLVYPEGYPGTNNPETHYTTDKKLDKLPSLADGYNWSTNSEAYEEPKTDELMTETTTLHAFLTAQPETFSVTFDTDGGEPIPDKQTVESGKYATRPTNDPQREGDIFKGWYVVVNDTMESEPFDFENSAIEVNLTLKAKWEEAEQPPQPGTYTVTFDADGGMPIPKEQTVESGEYATKPTNDPQREGYIFKGWYAVFNGAMESEPFDFENSAIETNLTLKAKWEDGEQPPQPAIKYIVSFIGGAGAAGNPPIMGPYEAGTNFNLPDNSFTMDGYTFTEWLYNGRPYAAGDPFIMPANNVTFTAQWTKDADPPQPEDKYTVFFTGGADDVWGTPPAPEQYAAGESFQLPVNPFYREGYFFTGWNDGEKTYGSGWTYTMPNQDVTFTARWEENLIPIFPPPSIGDGGGQSRPVYYPITAPSDVAVPGGSVTLDAKSASAGSIVTITAVPDAGYEVDYITVLDRDGYEVELTDRGNGVYTFVMPGSKVNVEYAFKPAGEVPEQPEQPDQPVQPEQPVQPAPDMPFADVGSGDWFHDAVQYVYNAGLMKGDGSETVFNPGGKVNRAMVWMILGRLSGADVDGSDGVWYAKAQAWAMAAGVTDGTDPTGCITREQMVTMLWRYFGSPAAAADLGVFSDSDAVSAWALDAMCWAVSTGLVNGENNRLNPGDDAARAQVAALLMRFCQSTEILPG